MSSTNNDNKILKGKVALVTGGSQGIGRAVALKLGQLGATVVINYSADAIKAAETSKELAAIGATGYVIKADVGIVSEVRKMFKELISKFGRLDIYVNNAGVVTMQKFVEVTEENYDRVFAINTKGTFFGLQEAAKVIQEGGRIIVISSAASKTTTPFPNFSVYTATKAAVEAFVRSLALELAEKKVTVNTVSPGSTDTKMVPEGFRTLGAQLSPFKRMGTGEDNAAVVGFLVSPDSIWVTGQNIQVSGGAVMN